MSSAADATASASKSCAKLTLRDFVARSKAVMAASRPGASLKRSREVSPEKVVAPQEAPPQPTPPTGANKGASARGDGKTEAPQPVRVGKKGVKFPAPDPSNPNCQKLRCVQRFVPHPPLSLSKRSKQFRFTSPLIYGACVAEEEVTDKLTDEDLLDVAFQKGGELLKFVEMTHARLSSKIKTQEGILADATRAASSEGWSTKVAALEAERDGLSRKYAEEQVLVAALREQLKKSAQEAEADVHRRAEENAKLSQEVEALAAVVNDLKSLLARQEAATREREEELVQAKADNKREVLDAYEETIRVVITKAEKLYPDAGVDWPSLLALSEGDLDQYDVPSED